MYNSSEFDKNFAFLFQIHLTRSSSRFENNDKNAKKKNLREIFKFSSEEDEKTRCSRCFSKIAKYAKLFPRWKIAPVLFTWNCCVASMARELLRRVNARVAARNVIKRDGQGRWRRKREKTLLTA